MNAILPVLLEHKKADLQGPAVGDTVIEIAPRELQDLRRELKEAVELFKSKPTTVLAPLIIKPQNNQAKPCCFIVMPFGDEDLNVVYEDFVKPIAEAECGLICERGDDVFGSNVIMDDILTSIGHSDLVIADLTRKNANVFYEVGICHALGKPVLLLAQSIEDVPFDLRHRRVLLYEYTPRGCKRLESRLKENIENILEKGK